MDNVRETIKNIRNLLEVEEDLNKVRDEISMELGLLEDTMDKLEIQNNSLKRKVGDILQDLHCDINGYLEKIGDILY